jgi:hypothetical protein
MTAGSMSWMKAASAWSKSGRRARLLTRSTTSAARAALRSRASFRLLRSKSLRSFPALCGSCSRRFEVFTVPG